MLCEAACFDVVLVETVGIGQSETAVGDMTDCFVALMLPGANDELQGIKKGLVELADMIAGQQGGRRQYQACQPCRCRLSRSGGWYYPRVIALSVRRTLAGGDLFGA